MSGLKKFGSWAASPLRQMEGSSFRILRAARPSCLNTSIQYELAADRRQQSAPIIKGGAIQYRFYSSQSEFGKKGKSYWSAIAAGLLGMGGISFISNKSEGGLFSFLLHSLGLFTTALCADNCQKDCVEKKCETSDCLRKTDCEEQVIQKANTDLERALKDTKGKAVEYTESALKAYCEAITALTEFMNKVYCAVEEENLDSPRFDEVWADVYNALKKRCELSKDAIEKGACAWELLKRLREIIENGKACRYTSCNPLLVTAEETLLCAERELCAKKQEMERLLKESRPVEQYRNLIEEFRRDLKAEADSLVPSEDCRVTLNDNEANMVLTHAYKKILRIQKEMNDGASDGC